MSRDGPTFLRRRTLLLGALGAGAAGAHEAHGADRAQGTPATPGTPNTYEPRFGQDGKDVIWAGTPDALVARMMVMGGVGPGDVVMDLGSGDGRIVLAAARTGAEAIGLEFNAELLALSRRRAEEAGLAARARFEQADIFEADFSRASVITLYLMPSLNLRLRPRLMALAPGTRILSHSFDMREWRPDESATAGGATGHLWVVPAHFGGDWLLRFALAGGASASGVMGIEQTFQQVRGDVAFAAFATSLRAPTVEGARIRFELTDADGARRQFDGRLAGDELHGTVTQPGGGAAPFSARRNGAAPPVRSAQPAAH